jgi:hypothetical protein
MVCDVALADFFSDVAPVCLIIASIVLLITVYRLTVASLGDREGAKAAQRGTRSPTPFPIQRSSYMNRNEPDGDIPDRFMV